MRIRLVPKHEVQYIWRKPQVWLPCGHLDLGTSEEGGRPVQCMHEYEAGRPPRRSRQTRVGGADPVRSTRKPGSAERTG